MHLHRNSAFFLNLSNSQLTHWGRVTHICVSKLSIIGSDNGLSPDRRQAIILTNAGILLIGPLGTDFSEILIEIQTFSFKKMRLKVSSAKWRPFCLGLNVLTDLATTTIPSHRRWIIFHIAGTPLKFEIHTLLYHRYHAIAQKRDKQCKNELLSTVYQHINM